MDSGAKLPENRIHLFDPIGLLSEKYGNHGVRTRRSTRSYDAGGLRFPVKAEVDSDSDGSSPRLWKSSTSSRKISSPPHELQPNHNHNHSQPMTPNSRIQAIARGRRELMEMIKDIPESHYELSLKDLVEKKPPPTPPPPVADPQQDSSKVDDVEKKFAQQVLEDTEENIGKEKQKQEKKKVGKSESKKKMVRNTSIDNGGLLLKTSVFPIPFRLKKKRSLNPAPSFKVAPPHTPSSKDLWRRKSRVSSESESETGGLTTSNGHTARSSRHRHSNKFLPSCCSFFSDKRIKAKK